MNFMKKFTSVLLIASMLTAIFSISITVDAAESNKNQVYVIIKNDTYSKEDGAVWDGTLVEEWVDIDENSTLMSAIVTALENNGYSQTGAEKNYISEIEGLSEFDGGFMSGWMGTLNDWFTNQGFGAYTVADGTLEAGDEICVMYTCEYGGDIGGSWYNNYTTLDEIKFSQGTLSEDFSSEITDYILTVPYDTENLVVTPTATNKNFQVRTYLNEFTPDVDGSEYKRTASIPVSDGDIIYVGVGDSNWPSMNYADEGTVYSFEVKFESAPVPETLGKVRVTISNDVFSVEDGAVWDGTLVDEWVDIYADSSMISAIVSALNNHNYSQSGAEYNYITEINGLSAGDASYMSGWMGTLNDWFTNEGFAAYTVSNGTLEDGDEIALMYTDAWGMDIGSDWSDSTTALAYADFSAGTLDKEFDPDITEYTLTVPYDTKSLSVVPTAFNKNFQTRTYLNEYTPTVNGSEYKRNELIAVNDGDVIYVGVGDSNWSSMNYSAGGTVYKFTIRFSQPPVIGDVDFDGDINIKDATLIQKYIVNLSELSEEQYFVADFNKDGSVDVNDATDIQKYLVGIYEE